MTEKIHTQQAIHIRLPTQLQHTDFKIPDVPVTHRQRVDNIDRCAYRAIGGIKNPGPTGVPVSNTRLLQRSGRHNRHGCTGIDQQTQTTIITRMHVNQEMLSAPDQRDARHFCCNRR